MSDIPNPWRGADWKTCDKPALTRERCQRAKYGHSGVQLKDQKVKVEAVHIGPVGRTENDIIKKHTEGILKAENFEDMVKESQKAKSLLEGLGLFQEVTIFIDVSRRRNASVHGYVVTLDVNEKRRLTGGVSTLVGTNDGSLLFNLKLPNLLGRAERLNAEYTYGTKNAVGFGLKFTKPLQGDPKLGFQAGAGQFTAEYPWSGYRETDRGINAALAFPTILGRHELHWDACWRELSCLSATTPFTVREHSGHSLKSSLKHVYTHDTRDSSVLPNIGSLVKLTQELAGVGGDVNFLKKDVELQYNHPLPFDSVFQVSFAGGLMKPIQPGSQIKLSDRFYIGGPLTLRGFNLRGAGPHADDAVQRPSYEERKGSSIGGDSYWMAAAHIYTPLPFQPALGGFGDNFRTHFFFNAGNLMNMDFNDHWQANLVKMAETLRCSYGAGMVMRFGAIARLELNYCLPLKFQRGDSPIRGMQFGIGINFL